MPGGRSMTVNKEVLISVQEFVVKEKVDSTVTDATEAMPSVSYPALVQQSRAWVPPTQMIHLIYYWYSKWLDLVNNVSIAEHFRDELFDQVK